ncbi:MAG: FAD-dependent oxidoreductase [Bacteroidetes bacterium]|nr:FAD-dependent oxidoreductase [Bacteroidota bacterium]
MSKKTGIIGAGIAGLAVAIRLAAKGHDVHVFEKNSWPGGKLSELRDSGFRFDMGPSLFTMPWLVDELYTLAGKDPKEHFTYEQLDTLCNYLFEDGTLIKAFRKPEDFGPEIENKTRDSAQSVLGFLEKAENIYNLTQNVFINRALHKLSNLTQRSFLKAFIHVGSIDAFRSMHSRNNKTFNDSKTVRIFDRYATYTGSDPYQAPATLNMIAHLEHNTGAFFPENGMYGIVSSLYELAISLGVNFHFNEPVKEILFSGRNATGILTGTRSYPFNFIVSDVDVHTLYGNILKSKPIPIKPANLSSSALVFYWGINKPFPGLDLHNILFSNNYKEEFRQLFSNQDVYIDPTIYIFNQII